MTVGDHARRQTRVAELFPNVVRMPTEGGVRTVPQVRAQPRAGLDRGGDLLVRGRGVSERHRDTGRNGPADEVGRSRQLRRQGHQPDPSAGRLLQFLEFFPIGGPDVFAGMRTAG